MPSKNYRYYRLDGAGMIQEAQWFDAENDADAEAQIAVMHPDASCEIWHDKRLVASVGPPTRRRLS